MLKLLVWLRANKILLKVDKTELVLFMSNNRISEYVDKK